MKLGKTIIFVCLVVATPIAMWAQNGKGADNAKQNGGGTCLLTQTSVPAILTTVEAEHLQFMREEEKLARDIYLTLSSKYPQRIFKNIAVSEQRHFDSIKILLDRYGLEDPAKAEPGLFTDPELQTLYNELLSKGSVSLLDALQVGEIIEETDIEDLRSAIAVTEHKDMLTVYGNLLNGSLNHLAAFESNIDIISQ